MPPSTSVGVVVPLLLLSAKTSVPVFAVLLPIWMTPPEVLTVRTAFDEPSWTWKAVVPLLFIVPDPLIRKVAVWSAELWFSIDAPPAPANCQEAPPLVLDHIKVPVLPGGILMPLIVK